MFVMFADSWKLYVRDVCFVNGTYSLPNDRRLPSHLLDPTTHDILHINYYQVGTPPGGDSSQWVPFFLALQAVLFYAPQAFWQWSQALGALELTPLVEESLKCRSMTADRVQHESRLVSLLITRLPAGTRITVLFLVVKMWYVVNVIGQWIALNRFLGPQYTFWGIEVCRNSLTSSFLPDIDGSVERQGVFRIAHLPAIHQMPVHHPDPRAIPIARGGMRAHAEHAQ